MNARAVFDRLYPSLFRYVYRLTGDADVADDVAQEAFVRLVERRLPESEAKPWLFTVATNLVRDGARKTTRRERLLTQAGPVPAASGADEAVEREERIAAVRSALDRLGPRDRQLLLMREEGFTYREMAGVIGVQPSSVGTLLARAVRRFVTVYREDGEADAAHG